MSIRLISALALVALATAGCTTRDAASPTRPGARASIPFIDSGSVYNWTADGNRAVYLQDRFRRWYRATLFAPCHDLLFAEAIGIETRGSDTLDSFGAIIVRGQRCPIQTLERSGPPPRKAKRNKGAAEADKAPPPR